MTGLRLDGLGVVVLTYGSSGVHLGLLDDLAAESVAPEQTVIVHNPARPGEAEPASPPGSELIRAERNGGYAGGMNLGLDRMRERDPDFVLLLTHDARLRPGAVDRLLAAARGGPRVGVLGPVLVVAGTERPHSYGGFTRSNGTSRHRLDPPPASADGIAWCDWVDGGTLLLGRAALATGARFDERFWGYCEESDFCLRVRRDGLGVGVVLDAVAEQAPGGAKRPGAYTYLITRNGAEYARRAVGRRGEAWVLGRALVLVLHCVVRVLARSVRRRPGGPALPWAEAVGISRGIVDFLRGRWGPPPSDLPGMGDVGNA